MHTAIKILAVMLSGAAVFSSVIALSGLATENSAIKQRLAEIIRRGRSPEGGAGSRKPGTQRVEAMINILSRLSLPEEGWQNSNLKVRFLQAGIRNKNAPRYYLAAKTVLALMLPAMLALYLQFSRQHFATAHYVIIALLAAAAGYYLPEMWLRFITRTRLDRMRDSLPDMIDLMVVCTESGMGIDGAIARISREMSRTNPDLAQEFYLSSIEMRAGASRVEALRNLALRTRLGDLEELVSVLVQADRFGTSLTDSLRVQSDMMRTRRTQRAEEIAAKIPVKMALPLVLFIFPTLMIVLLGPAIIQIIEAFSSR